MLQKRLKILIIICLVFATIFWLFNRFKEKSIVKPTENYTTLALPNLVSNYTIGNNIFLKNEISIPESISTDNYYFFKQNDSTEEIIQRACESLGLKKKSSNYLKGIVKWYRDDPNKDFLLFDLVNNTVQMQYLSGLNKESVDPTKTLEYIYNILSLKVPDHEIINIADTKNRQVIFIKYKFNGKPIYTETGMNLSSTIDMTDGKILSFKIQLLASDMNFSQSTDKLKSISLLNQEKMSSYNYMIEASPDKKVETGGETISDLFASNNPEVYLEGEITQAYVYKYIRSNKLALLAPAFEVNGKYIDKMNERGTAKFIVINEQ